MSAAITSINDRYRILRTVGTGGMGNVYAAQDERLGRVVALKLLRADLATDARARERFLREAQLAAQLRHPHIVRTYDVGESPEGPYLVQELLDGRTLDQALPLPPSETVAVIDQVADALSYIHEQGYVHCDIKPHNIMLLDDPAAPGSAPRAVLLDFGIARVAGTDTTTLIATPHYLAPERALGAAPTAASDLYALGIVFYQTLTGRPPFDAPDLQGVIAQHQRAPLPPLNLPQPEVAALKPLIDRLAAKQPDARYPSAQAFRADLAAVRRSPAHEHATIAINKPDQPARPATAPPVKPPAAAITATPTTHKQIGRRFLWLPLLLGLLLVGGLAMRAGATDDQPPATVVPSSSPSASAAAVQTVNVPAVIGLPIEQAQQQIEAVGLDFVVGERVSNPQPADTVVSTNPGPDQPLATGAQVVVEISAGPPAAPPVEAAPPAQAAPPPPADNKGKDDKKNKDDKKDKDKKGKDD